MRPTIMYDRASVRAFAPEARPTVYRIYAGPELIYAGATLHPRPRLLRHLNRARFYGTEVQFEFFRNPTAMLRAERAAIAEGPVRNCKTAGRHGSWKVRRYPHPVVVACVVEVL